MEIRIDQQVITVYGVPTVGKLRELIAGLGEEYNNHVFRTELISPEQKKELTMMPILQQLESNIEQGIITREDANTATEFLRNLSLNEISNMTKSLKEGILTL